MNSNSHSQVIECRNLTGGGKPSDCIFSQWQFLVRFLRSVGNCPLELSVKKISFGENSTQEIRTLQFHTFSFTTFYTFLTHIFRFGLCYFYYRDWGLTLLGRRYSDDTLEDWIVKTMNISLPFYQLWDMFCVWITIRKVAQLCNTWLEFESKFNETFSSYYDYSCTLRQWRCRLIFTCLVPVGAVAGIMIMDLAALTENSTGRLAAYPLGTIWEIISGGLFILSTPLFIFISVLEEVKVLLMYRTLTEAYLNVRQGIQSQVKEGNLLTEDIVSQWTKLIGIIRRQGKLTGQLQAPQQLVLLIHGFVIFTQCLFLFIKTSMANQRTKYIWACTMVSCIFALRLFAKIVMADNITVEEQKLGDEIIEIDPCNLDILGKLEAKKVTDLILHKPMRISFSDYIVLQKQIIPRILSCIVAYLVILLQFQLSHGYNYYCDNENRTTF